MVNVSGKSFLRTLVRDMMTMSSRPSAGTPPSSSESGWCPGRRIRHLPVVFDGEIVGLCRSGTW